MTAQPASPNLPDERAVADVCEGLPVQLLIMFGSRVPGGLAPAPDSDIDIALRYHAGQQRPRFFEAYDRLLPLFAPATLDLVILHDVDPLFRWEIMERGVLLYGDVNDFLEYRAFAFRDFTDSADLRQLERTLFDRKMSFIAEQLRAAP